MILLILMDMRHPDDYFLDEHENMRPKTQDESLSIGRNQVWMRKTYANNRVSSRLSK
jgi:hypothetical protein